MPRLRMSRDIPPLPLHPLTKRTGGKKTTLFNFTFISKQPQFLFNCTTIPLHFHVVPATTEAFIVSWDEIFYSLLVSISSASYVVGRLATTVSTSTLTGMLVPQPRIYSQCTSGMHKSWTTKCSTVPLISKYPQYRTSSTWPSRGPRFLMRQNFLTPGASNFVTQFAPRRHARIF
jgi:hypothetical protein